MRGAEVLRLLAGLALFLYGMQMMSTGLEEAAGKRLQRLLSRLTDRPLAGVLVGTGVTAVIQSSSAVTVMVVGFVNAGVMTLKQAVGVIMGANIGTTVTGQLVALDFGQLAPIFAICGVLPAVFSKRRALRLCGQVTAGLGFLFLGMTEMSEALAPLARSPQFIRLLTAFESPLLGILAGTVFTAVIQSSSAAVGILQALAANGLIGADAAVYVLFGQNIGTCVTAALAAVGTSQNAKRAAAVHILFNAIGTAIFTPLCMAMPLAELMQALAPGDPAAQIAHFHTLFNMASTLLLFPFGGALARLSERLLPDEKRRRPRRNRRLRPEKGICNMRTPHNTEAPTFR